MPRGGPDIGALLKPDEVREWRSLTVENPKSKPTAAEAAALKEKKAAEKKGKDQTSSEICFKRAKSAAQKERHGFLAKAAKLLEDKHGNKEEVKIDWPERQVLVKGFPVFEQEGGKRRQVHVSFRSAQHVGSLGGASFQDFFDGIAWI